jgi:capsid protein
MKRVDSKFIDVHWQARGWPWVDPKKDAEANRINLAMGVETRQNILSQQGRDFDDTLDQLAYEKARADEKGISIDDFSIEAQPPEIDDDET